MVDSVQVWPPDFRVTDSDDAPVSGAKLYFYDAGTTDAQTVHSDKDRTAALPNPIICDSSGRPTSDGNAVTLVYVGTSDYKVVVADSDDVTLGTYDNCRGGLDTSSFSTGGGGSNRSTEIIATDEIVETSDDGKLYQANPTGGTFTVTLEDAVTATDGFEFEVRHDGSANQVRIATVSNQTIDVPGAQAASGYALTGLGHHVRLTPNGS